LVEIGLRKGRRFPMLKPCDMVKVLVANLEEKTS